MHDIFRVKEAACASKSELSKGILTQMNVCMCLDSAIQWKKVGTVPNSIEINEQPRCVFKIVFQARN